MNALQTVRVVRSPLPDPSVRLDHLVGIWCAMTRTGTAGSRMYLPGPDLEALLLQCPAIGRPMILGVADSRLVWTSPIVGIHVLESPLLTVSVATERSCYRLAYREFRKAA